MTTKKFATPQPIDAAASPPKAKAKGGRPKKPAPKPKYESDSPFSDAGAEAARKAKAPAVIKPQAIDRPGKKRTPLGTREPKLAIEERPSFHRRWFNDTPGRIRKAKRAGYEMVLDEDGRPTSLPGSSTQKLEIFLMEIPQHLYDEDFALKNAELDAIDNQIKNRGRDVRDEDRIVVSPNSDMRIAKGPGAQRTRTG